MFQHLRALVWRPPGGSTSGSAGLNIGYDCVPSIADCDDTGSGDDPLVVLVHSRVIYTCYPHRAVVSLKVSWVIINNDWW